MQTKYAWDTVKCWVQHKAPALYAGFLKIKRPLPVNIIYLKGAIKKQIFIMKAKKIAKTNFKKINQNNVNNKSITVITGYTEAIKDLADITTRYLIKYCEFNGYDHFIYTEKDFSHNMKPAWSKLIFINKEFEKGYQYVLWVDADAIITNANYKLESIIENDKDIYISKDVNGLNTGIVMFKNTDKVKNILNKLLEMHDRFYNHAWFEQAAFIDLYEMNEYGTRDLCKIMPQSEWNAYLYLIFYRIRYPAGEWSQSSFTLHFPGFPLDTRLAILKYFK